MSCYEMFEYICRVQTPCALHTWTNMRVELGCIVHVLIQCQRCKQAETSRRELRINLCFMAKLFLCSLVSRNILLDLHLRRCCCCCYLMLLVPSFHTGVHGANSTWHTWKKKKWSHYYWIKSFIRLSCFSENHSRTIHFKCAHHDSMTGEKNCFGKKKTREMSSTNRLTTAAPAPAPATSEHLWNGFFASKEIVSCHPPTHTLSMPRIELTIFSSDN